LKTLWNTITLIGHQKLSDPADLRQLKLLNSISILGSVNLLFLTPVAFIMNVPIVAFCTLAGVLLSSVTLILNAAGYFTSSRVYFIIVTQLFLVTLLVTVSGKEGGTEMVFIMSAVLHLVLFKGTRYAIPVFVLVMALMGLCAWWVENHSSFLDNFSYSQKRTSYYLNIVSCMALVFAIILHFKNAANEFESTITEQNKHISEKNKDILDSISYARRLQEAILPPDSLVKQYLPQSFIYYKPKDIVAGDFYWLERSDAHNCIFIAAADCTGHGVPGALVSVVCSNALNRTVKEFGITQPAKILDKTRELVIETFAKSENEVKDGMDISLCAISLNSTKGMRTVEWAGANNPLWICGKEGIKEIKADKQPIGTYSLQTQFTNHRMELNEGDMLYLFTDGYADQFGGPRGKKYMYKRLSENLLSFSKNNLDKQQDDLKKSFEDWKSDLEQVDDVCVIGIRL
jgi:serine phosphatase RsbU (regulator of sigma subunit)